MGDLVPLPRWLARVNKAGLNRVMNHAGPWLPSFAVVVHRGRKSGRRYETPVMVFRHGDEHVIALTYGSARTEWVRNIIAAGGCDLRTAGRVLKLGTPRVYRDETRAAVRPFERQVLKLMGADEFLSLTRVG